MFGPVVANRRGVSPGGIPALAESRLRAAGLHVEERRAPCEVPVFPARRSLGGGWRAGRRRDLSFSAGSNGDQHSEKPQNLAHIPPSLFSNAQNAIKPAQKNPWDRKGSKESQGKPAEDLELV